MCSNNTNWLHAPPARKHRSKQSKVQVYRLSRKRCEEKVEEDMELKNLKLYLENQSIIEENEKLRKKANLLHQENLALMSEFQKNFHIWIASPLPSCFCINNDAEETKNFWQPSSHPFFPFTLQCPFPSPT